MLFVHRVNGGDLLNYLNKNGRLTEEASKRLFHQIIEGIKFCHDNNIVHRDLKVC